VNSRGIHLEAVSPSAIDRLVDEYRLRCLWFLRPDYYPSTDAERIRVLTYIERHGDRDAYRRAREMRRWLSQTSNALRPTCGR
jgi:hypothetical protein